MQQTLTESWTGAASPTVAPAHERNCLVRHRGKWAWVTPHVAMLCAWDKMHECVQKSDVWLQRRRHMLTASAVASALDMNPYESRDELIKHYAGVSDKPQFTGNDATRHGEKYEDEAVELFENRTGHVVLTFGLMPFFDPKLAHLGGSVDGITASGDLVEVKCPYYRRPKADDIPKYYYPQVLSMMCGFDLPRTFFIEYVPESTWVAQQYFVHDIKRRDRFLDENHAYLLEFWYRVCECRKEADRNCFSANPRPQKKPRKKRVKPTMPCLVVVPPTAATAAAAATQLQNEADLTILPVSAV